MEIWKALDQLERLERGMARAYEWMAELFQDDADAAAFFTRMARDEVSHANLVTYERRMVRADPKAFAGRLEIPDDVIAKAVQCIDEFRRDSPSPTLVEALRFALKMEVDCAENLHRDAVLQANPGLTKLISSLAKADASHFEQLERFANERAHLFD